ncbi:hypothetical protein EFR01_16050 [Sinorhizobium fredii]|nr:hypothetical protein EFR01_16050 [Sinorhizobium fredii]GLS09137.1 hypothetical protein GCM10007864_27670 [Sinorhizobium fredii]
MPSSVMAGFIRDVVFSCNKRGSTIQSFQLGGDRLAALERGAAPLLGFNPRTNPLPARGERGLAGSRHRNVQEGRGAAARSPLPVKTGRRWPAGRMRGEPIRPTAFADQKILANSSTFEAS